jgi:hypothetical protein
MLDPRIYRTGFVVVALAVVVLAFSFENQPGALPASLAPEAFNGGNVYRTMTRLASQYPFRRPGSQGDNDIASVVSMGLAKYGFAPTTTTFAAQTADGSRTLENVVGSRSGVQSGSIVILASRDARGSPSIASLSGTAALLELARDLEGETLPRTVVLASTSGTQGQSGALQSARSLAGPVDAVIVLGDLASTDVHQPVIIPWSTSPAVAPPALRNTVAAQLNQQAAIGSAGSSVFGQFAHLAFPLTISAQGPFGAYGIPAVELSLSGERGPAPDALVSGPDQLAAVGRSVLSTISALQSGPDIPAPSAYVLFDNDVVPGWAISLFVLALVIPVLLTTIDGIARAKRRGYHVWRWLLVVLAAAAPFALAVVIVLGARLIGLFGVAPPGPLGPGAVPLHAGGIALMIIVGLIIFGSLLVLAPVAIRFAGGPARTRDREGTVSGAMLAVLLAMCLITIAIWLANPFAAALLVPALHLWLIALLPDVRVPVPIRITLLLLGLAPAVLLIVYYSSTLGFGPIQVLWGAALLVAGHVISPLMALAWSGFLGCAVTAGAVVVALARQPRAERAPVTVRGPVTYAGPGSLGGTKSALRRH